VIAMSRCVKTIIVFICLAVCVPCLSYPGEQDVESVVDRFKAATDIQRQQLQEQYLYSNASFTVTVQNVEEADRFDERTDTRQRYYKVVSVPRKTSAQNLYQLDIFYKDANKVKEIKEGQKLDAGGALVRITDELSQITVWYFGEEMGPEDKEMFK
jgi:hypothetical protein